MVTGTLCMQILQNNKNIEEKRFKGVVLMAQRPFAVILLKYQGNTDILNGNINRKSELINGRDSSIDSLL